MFVIQDYEWHNLWLFNQWHLIRKKRPVSCFFLVIYEIKPMFNLNVANKIDCSTSNFFNVKINSSDWIVYTITTKALKKCVLYIFWYRSKYTCTWPLRIWIFRVNLFHQIVILVSHNKEVSSAIIDCYYIKEKKETPRFCIQGNIQLSLQLVIFHNETLQNIKLTVLIIATLQGNYTN